MVSMVLFSPSPLKVDPSWFQTINSSHPLSIGYEEFRWVNDPLGSVMHKIISCWELILLYQNNIMLIASEKEIFFLLLAQLSLTIILFPQGKPLLRWTSAVESKEERAKEIKFLLTSLIYLLDQSCSEIQLTFGDFFYMSQYIFFIV